MNHKEVWTEIAEAFLTPKGEGTSEQRATAHCGLCMATRFESREVCRFLIGLSPNGLCWFPSRIGTGHRREYDLIRGDFATLMACMTEKEFDELLAPTGAQQKDK